MASRTGQRAVAVFKKLQSVYKLSGSPELEMPQLALILLMRQQCQTKSGIIFVSKFKTPENLKTVYSPAIKKGSGLTSVYMLPCKGRGRGCA